MGIKLKKNQYVVHHLWKLINEIVLEDIKEILKDDSEASKEDIFGGYKITQVKRYINMNGLDE